MMSWKTFVARSALAATMIGVAVFAGVRLASAGPGAPGGPTTDSMTFAGVLRERAGMSTQLTFVFRKTGAGGAATEVCRSTTGMFTPAASGGAFSVLVSIDPSSTNCPRGLFDGADVWYDILLAEGDAGTTITDSPVPITPVPYARFADQAGVNNDCPAGYSVRPPDTTFRNEMRLCVRPVVIAGVTYNDEVVRVGRGSSAFWIDRYESAAIGDNGVQYGNSSGAGYGQLTRSGQWSSDGGAGPSGRAVSFALTSAAAYLTWFQANELCRAAGKRLPTRSEWISAAQGTIDPGANAAVLGSGVVANGDCNTSGMGPRNTGRGDACRSAWGAQDMIGNLGEWTDEWYSSVGALNTPSLTVSGAGVAMGIASSGATVTGVSVNSTQGLWGAGYGDGQDGTTNITSTVDRSAVAVTGDTVTGLPAAAIRGGGWVRGVRNGIFYLDLGQGPTFSQGDVGFRCVVDH